MPKRPAEDPRSHPWPEGVVWKKHKRKGSDGEVEEVSTPYVRVRYTGEDGERRAVWVQVKDPEHARRARRKIVEKLERGEAKEIAHDRMTFARLADYYEKTYLIPAVYADGNKVAGVRDLVTAKGHLKSLRLHLGQRRLRDVTYGTLKELKLKLLLDPDPRRRPAAGGQGSGGAQPARSLASVHRKLSLLRHMFRVAKREGWLAQSPFERGEPLINVDKERKRLRVMSYEEEARILSQCTGRRAHLRLVVVGLADTAMRRGEAFKLRVRDIGFDPREIGIEQMNTKTLTARSAPVTRRLAEELRRHFEEHELGPDDLVFGFKSVRTAWDNACRAAGVSDLRLRDLRRTAATRLVRAGMPISEVSRVLGHTDIKMTYEYVGVDGDTTRRAAAALDEHIEGAQAQALLNLLRLADAFPWILRLPLFVPPPAEPPRTGARPGGAKTGGIPARARAAGRGERP